MNSTDRNLAEGVCESIRHATPNFRWTPRRSGRRSVMVAAAVLAAVVSLSAFAGRAHAAHVPGALFAEVSAEGETQAQFLHRVGARMRKHSDRFGAEVCAPIGTDGERFGVIVTTSNSEAVCGIVFANVPNGMRPTGETIHTHAKRDRKDSVFHMDQFGPGDWVVPGYLAAPGGVLLYQSGKGTQREVAL